MLNNIASMLGAGGATVGDYQSIQTVTVGAGGSATVTFSSIPSTYTHLEIRGVWVTASNSYLSVTANSAAMDKSHIIYGTGSAASVYTGGNVLEIENGLGTSPYCGIISILDYTNTNKNKVIRTLSGADNNSGGVINFSSGLFLTTSAISSFALTGVSANFTSGTTFALYGIK